VTTPPNKESRRQDGMPYIYNLPTANPSFPTATNSLIPFIDAVLSQKFWTPTVC